MSATVAQSGPINPPCIAERTDPAARWSARRPFRAASESSNHLPAIVLGQTMSHPSMAKSHVVSSGQHIVPRER
jgi:hypothetical protein